MIAQANLVAILPSSVITNGPLIWIPQAVHISLEWQMVRVTARDSNLNRRPTSLSPYSYDWTDLLSTTKLIPDRYPLSQIRFGRWQQRFATCWQGLLRTVCSASRLPP